MNKKIEKIEIICDKRIGPWKLVFHDKTDNVFNFED